MTIRTQENADIIVEAITDGTPLRQICREIGISKSAVYDWFDDDAALSGRITQARVRGFDEIAESTMEISDDLTEEPASRKVRIDTRLKLLAKWDPKRYGELIKHSGPNGDEAAVTALQVSFVAPGQQAPDAG